MATVDLDRQQYRHLTDLLAAQAELLNAAQRQALLERAGLGQFIARLNFDVEPRLFASQIVRVLQNHGTLKETGQPALVGILEELREIVAGHAEEVAFLDDLLVPYPQPTTSASLPSRSNAPTLPCSTASRILFLAANPHGTDGLYLDREARTIQERLDEGPRNRFVVQHGLALRYSDLSRLLLQHRPHLVHFAGHGASSGEILVEDEAGDLFPLRPDTLAALCGLVRADLRCVLINACWSEQQARAIVEQVPVVIGMSEQVSDGGARAFAGGFYRGLSFGEPLGTAFDLGKIELGMVLPEAQEVPQLLVQPGVDARDLRFV